MTVGIGVCPLVVMSRDSGRQRNGSTMCTLHASPCPCGAFSKCNAVHPLHLGMYMGVLMPRLVLMMTVAAAESGGARASS